MKDTAIFFDYSCGICGKHTEDKMYPVVYLKENILICETCLSFIKDHGDDSTFKEVKK